MNYLRSIRERRSVRTFDSPPSSEDLEKLEAFVKDVDNPLGIMLRWHFIDNSKDRISVPVIIGTDCYVTALIDDAPYALEAFGYSFEKFVLHAWSLGIGTTWIAGTMDRKAFEDKIGLKDGELMPCISPLGYAAKKMSKRESLMRMGIKADSRKKAEELFFSGSFESSLELADDDPLKDLFEAVRLAPSAVNGQPWRLLKEEDRIHFYKMMNKGVVNDVRNIDMGIALAHFDLAAQEKGIGVRFLIERPAIACPDDLRYIGSFEVLG